VDDPEARNQIVLLINGPNLPPHRAKPSPVEIRYFITIDPQFSRSRLQGTIQHAEKSGFAPAAWTDEGYSLRALNFEVDAVDCRLMAVEGFRYFFQAILVHPSVLRTNTNVLNPVTSSPIQYEMLHCVQHDKKSVIPSASEESHAF
jgi:hypothetical protein